MAIERRNSLIPRRLSSDLIDLNNTTPIESSTSTSSPTRRVKRSLIAKACAVALLVTICVNDLFYTDYLRRKLACKRHMKKIRKNGGQLQPGSAYDPTYGDNFFTNLIDRTLQIDSIDGASECDIVFPEADVVTDVGTAYYAPPNVDSGLYYNEVAEIPIAEMDSVDTENLDPTALVPDVEVTTVDPVDTSLMESYEPKVYEPIEATGEPAPIDTVAYTVVITSCPNTYEPPNSEVTDPGTELYEACAMIKNGVCNATADSASSTSLVRRRRVEERVNSSFLGGRRLQEDSGYTMYALIHPEAINCVNPDGTTYNRVEMLQNQGYYVQIAGQAITNTNLAQNQTYIAENIEDDVGIRDSVALHAFNLEHHNAVVLLDYSTQLQASIETEIQELIQNPNKQVKAVRDKDGCVSKAFMIIKPSKAKFEYYRDLYLSTPYDPVLGWNSQGHNTCRGKLGLKGFFSYVASVDPTWEELDRCTYNNQLDDVCVFAKDVDDSKVVRHSKTVCGEPRDCPYDHPLWSSKKKEACQKAHANYFKSRIEFEDKHFIKTRTQERIGRFKWKSFLGYCNGPGKSNYLGLSGQIHRKPEWQVVCNNIDVCPPGFYMKNDCTCTQPGEDPCNACPANTRCQRTPELRCLDCSCGFCDANGVPCCDFNGINNCKSGLGDSTECVMQKNFFPGFGGEGNVCSGVEISDTATPNGCGCKPNDGLPCTFNPDLKNVHEDACHICTSADLVQGKCPACVDCLANCGTCITSANTVSTTEQCLKRMDDDCRNQCTAVCKK